MVCLLLLALAGCDKTATPQKASSASQADAKRYQLKGRFISADKSGHTITIDGEEIPNFMDAMIMPYTVKDLSLLDKLSPGDQITGDVVVLGDESWVENIKVIGHTEPPKPAAAVHIPTAGEAVPNFQFTNQDGRAISLQQYRGQVLLVTFIYTRCPFADYCPRMTHEFSEIYSRLQKDSTLLAKTRLLSISIDPAHDTPKALRAYGLANGDKNPQMFRSWQFAAPVAADLSKITNFFGLSYISQADTITHSLSTAVIAPDGSIFKWYHGSDWTPSDLLKDTADALHAIRPTPAS